MLRFGIIAEGVTDQYVIENILLGYFEHLEEPAILPIQPPPGGAGGWGRVLQSLERGDHEGALQFSSDYVIIQIDTDVSEQRGYDVSWREAGRELSVPELVARVIERLKREIDPAFYEANRARILFAVAVHETECWLLPLLHDDSKAAKITGCTTAVNHALLGRKLNPLVRGGEKQKTAYDEASAGYRRRKKLLALGARNPSLKLFLDQLERIGPADPAAD